MDGFGSKFAIGLGTILSTIERDIVLLYESFLQIEVIRDSMLQNIDLLAGKDLIDEENKGSEKELKIKGLTDEIDKINLNIENLNNKLLESWKFEKRILTLDKSKIIHLYKERFDKKWSNHESLELANEKFQLKISFEINKPLNSIKEFLDQFEDLEKFSGYETLNMPYKKNVQEAIHINSIGYGKTAVLCVGRTIEKAINEYLKELIKREKITQKEFDEFINTKCNNKIGFLKSRGFVDEEEFTKLKAFSFDRDKGGHPDLGEIDNQRARTLVQQGIWLVIDLQKKIEKVEKELEIEQDKTRELLGGKSLHSSFLIDK